MNNELMENARSGANEKLVVCGIICLFLGVRIGMDGMVDSEKYEDLKDKHNKQVEINSDLMSNKEAIEKELADLKEKTKNYIELNETEKRRRKKLC